MKPSLEGWKRGDSEVRLVAWHALKPSLEGWKLGLVVGVPRLPVGLETFLRGMETSASRSPAISSSSLETFLRGMETEVPRELPAL